MDTDKLVGNKLRNFAAVNWFLLIAWLVDLKFDMLKYSGQTLDIIIGRPTVLVIVCIAGYVYLFVRFWFDYNHNIFTNLFDKRKSNYERTLSNIVKKYMNRRFEYEYNSTKGSSKGIYNHVQVNASGRHIRFNYKGKVISKNQTIESSGENNITISHFRYCLWHHISMFKSAKSNIIGDYLVAFILMYANIILYIGLFIYTALNPCIICKVEVVFLCP